MLIEEPQYVEVEVWHHAFVIDGDVINIMCLTDYVVVLAIQNDITSFTIEVQNKILFPEPVLVLHI
jgi:hypothetical protein